MTTPAHPFPPRGGTLAIAGQDIVLAYEDAAAEYEALRTNAIVVDRSHRGRLRMFGEKGGEALTGLVTNDVLAMQPGEGRYGAALTAKGRILADVRIFASTGAYLIDASARAWPGFLGMIKKYVNPRIAGYRDDSHAVRDFGVFGPRASRIVSTLTSVDAATLEALSSYDHVVGKIGDASVSVVRSPDIEIEGYEILVPFEIFDLGWSAAVSAGAVPAGLAAWEIARIEAGRPEWGIDIDESTIPQEANFDDLEAISYTKGCYIGQEVVARVHFRGHVNRHLRGLRSTSADAPPTGAQLADDAGNHVGEVRSSVVSPRLGGIAIGMVRREVMPGATLHAKWDGGERRVEVTTLPFSA